MIPSTKHFGWSLPPPGAVGYHAAVSSLLQHIDTSVASLLSAGTGRYTVVISCFASTSSQIQTTSYITGSLAPFGAWQGSFRVTRPGLIAVHAQLDFISGTPFLTSFARRHAWNAVLTRLDGGPSSMFLLVEPFVSWGIEWDLSDQMAPSPVMQITSLEPGPYGLALQTRVESRSTSTGSTTYRFTPGTGVWVAVEEL